MRDGLGCQGCRQTGIVLVWAPRPDLSGHLPTLRFAQGKR